MQESQGPGLGDCQADTTNADSQSHGVYDLFQQQSHHPAGPFAANAHKQFVPIARSRPTTGGEPASSLESTLDQGMRALAAKGAHLAAAAAGSLKAAEGPGRCRTVAAQGLERMGSRVA